MVSANSAFRCSYKLRYPAASVIVVAIGDEDVIFEVGEEGWHGSNIKK